MSFWLWRGRAGWGGPLGYLTGIESLKASEFRVARIAADGLPNREIAQTLFVTVRTDEGHLTHAYRKLGISSRAELVDALGEAPQSPFGNEFVE